MVKNTPETQTDQPEIAETDTTETQPASYVEAIIADRSRYRAVGDCWYFGQVAYKAGAAVSASHPSVPRWLANGSIERVG